MFSDAASFNLEFPKDADDNSKARLLGSTMFECSSLRRATSERCRGTVESLSRAPQLSHSRVSRYGGVNEQGESRIWWSQRTGRVKNEGARSVAATVWETRAHGAR